MIIIPDFNLPCLVRLSALGVIRTSIEILSFVQPLFCLAEGLLVSRTSGTSEYCSLRLKLPLLFLLRPVNNF